MTAQEAKILTLSSGENSVFEGIKKRAEQGYNYLVMDKDILVLWSDLKRLGYTIMNGTDCKNVFVASISEDGPDWAIMW